jgi:hypothetical protein
MATIESLTAHISKAKKNFQEEIKKTDDPKNNLDVRARRKKVKRLTRKSNKLTATAQMAEEKKKPKKERTKVEE